MHAIEVLRDPRDPSGAWSIFTADNLGVSRVAMRGHGSGDATDRVLIPGAPGKAPARGSSEVHLGRLAGGRFFLATIDPWHGSEVAVCVSEPGAPDSFGPRSVIDPTLDLGHALWVADVDGDGNDEIFAGHRGKNARVSAYRYDGKSWTQTVLDSGVVGKSPTVIK
jgi:hypothetical protein